MARLILTIESDDGDRVSVPREVDETGLRVIGFRMTPSAAAKTLLGEMLQEAVEILPFPEAEEAR